MQLLYLKLVPQSLTTDRRRSAAVRAATIVLCLLCAGPSRASAPPLAPDFAVVARAVEDHFASLADYQKGDLISRAQIAHALVSVKDAGWDVPDAEKIAQLGLANDSFLVVRLTTPSGRDFMRRIGKQPGGYARLDRLSSLARGQAIVNDLIYYPGGDVLIRYLATTAGGKAMGKQLAATPNGVDVNKPTGRIYTAEDLIAALERVWEKK